ncbi:MAG: hypothetical protein IH588_07680 [Anaerolineales bacterium]|nr:hypothetical protein [Anaerolineales bacterium]
MQLEFATVTWPVPALWGLALVVLLIGFFIGYVDSNVRSVKKIEAAETKEKNARAEAEKKLAEAGISKASAPSATDDPGLLRLKYKNGEPFLELDGKIVTPKNVSPDQKKRLIELITVMRPWVEGGQIAPAVSHPSASQQTPLAPVSPAEVVSRPLQPAKKAEVEKPFASLSIVQQIDSILQERLLNTPLEKSGLRLHESLQGGVEVYVGVQKFDSIDDVPDPVMKSTIRAAIAEWEEKYTPGI